MTATVICLEERRPAPPPKPDRELGVLRRMVRERDEALALVKELKAEIAMLRSNAQPDADDATGWRERM
jgi:hypothetical protein